MSYTFPEQLSFTPFPYLYLFRFSSLFSVVHEREVDSSHFHFIICAIILQSPAPRLRMGPWPLRNWVPQQEVSSRLESEASPVFTATSHHSHCCLSCTSALQAPNPPVEKLSSMKPVPCAKKVGDHCYNIIPIKWYHTPSSYSPSDYIYPVMNSLSKDIHSGLSLASLNFSKFLLFCLEVVAP